MRRNGFVSGLMYVTMILLAVGLGVLVFFNYQANRQQMEEIAAAEEAAAVTPTPPPTETPAPTPTPSRNTETVTIAFAGDIVGQAGLTTDAQQTEEDDDGTQSVTYDYTRELSGVSSALEGTSMAGCTLVGTLSDGEEYDSYRMNTALADAVSAAGFNLVNTASDHILDYELDGLTGTISALQDRGLGVVGTHASEDSQSILTADIGGTSVAFLSYTYGTGGVSVADNSWCVDLLTTDYMTDQVTVDYERIDEDLATVKEAGTDIVVCFVYWWDNTQYYTSPRDNQREVVTYLWENGVDIVIGSGVKVPQPIETAVVERADGTTANCVACYSLSNLMSAFSDQYTDLSAVAKLQLTRDTDTGEVWVSGVSYDPLFMLDTDEYSAYGEADYKFQLLDAYDTVEAYDAGAEDAVSEAVYQAVMTGISDLQTLLGAEYDAQNGGVTLDCPYD